MECNGMFPKDGQIQSYHPKILNMICYYDSSNEFSTVHSGLQPTVHCARQVQGTAIRGDRHQTNYCSLVQECDLLWLNLKTLKSV